MQIERLVQQKEGQLALPQHGELRVRQGGAAQRDENGFAGRRHRRGDIRVGRARRAVQWPQGFVHHGEGSGDLGAIVQMEGGRMWLAIEFSGNVRAEPAAVVIAQRLTGRQLRIDLDMRQQHDGGRLRVAAVGDDGDLAGPCSGFRS